jgi:hypothetical protein
MSLKKAVTIEIVVILSIATFLLPGGDDLYHFYLPFAHGCLDCGFAPYHASWMLYPMTFIQPRLLWPVWTLVTLLSLLWASHRLNTNALLLLLTFPAIGQVWLGQVDALLVIGLVLALLSPNPYVRGTGLVLASIKPQVTGVAILVIWRHELERWKTLLVPLVVLLISLLVWGWNWPLRWLFARNEPPLHVWRLATLFPYGLLTFLALFWLKDKPRQVQGALLASSLGMPFYGTYSYIVFLVFLAPWWAVPVSYLWFIGYPWYGNEAMRFAWILPMSLSVYLLWPLLLEKYKATFSFQVEP